MDVGFTIRQRIRRPAGAVFEAIADPGQLSGYFTKTASRRLEPDATVTWTFADGDCDDLDVTQVVPDERIVFTWKAYKVDYSTTVTFDLNETDDGQTVVELSETGWQKDDTSLQSSHAHCAGWQHMLLSLKAYLEHGIDLRSEH
jgi:uncharacterized protein YndB with AHSA1/START domain